MVKSGEVNMTALYDCASSEVRSKTLQPWKRRMQVSLTLGLILMIIFSGVSLPVYAAVPEDVNLTVKQVFINTGTETPPTETFTYWLIPELATNPMPAGSANGRYVFNMTGSESISMGAMTFTAVGTYRYQLSCIISAVPGYNYDRQVYSIEINIYENANALYIIRNEDGEKAAELAFTHRFGLDLSDPDAMVDPPVRKTVTGRPNEAGLFTFRLVADDLSYPMPEGSSGGVKTIQISGNGTAEFGTWNYVQEGIFSYTVSEINTGATGYVYDSEVYKIIDDVRFIGGHLVVARSISTSAGAGASGLDFTNRYQSTGESVTVSGMKTWRHGKQDSRNYPQVITVVLLADGAPVAQKQVTASDGWRYSFVVDKYDEQGYEIVYTIDELRVANYSKLVDGYNITNTYTGPEAPRPPFTGDDSNSTVFSYLFGVASVIALMCVWYLLTDRRRRQEMALAMADGDAEVGVGGADAGAGAGGADGVGAADIVLAATATDTAVLEKPAEIALSEAFSEEAVTEEDPADIEAIKPQAVKAEVEAVAAEAAGEAAEVEAEAEVSETEAAEVEAEAAAEEETAEAETKEVAEETAEAETAEAEVEVTEETEASDAESTEGTADIETMETETAVEAAKTEDDIAEKPIDKDSSATE